LFARMRVGATASIVPAVLALQDVGRFV
jgi:hypothetical protein